MHEGKDVSGNELQLRKKSLQVAVMLKGDRKKRENDGKRPERNVKVGKFFYCRCTTMRLQLSLVVLFAANQPSNNKCYPL